jgi:hypothetical protein
MRGHFNFSTNKKRAAEQRPGGESKPQLAAPFLREGWFVITVVLFVGFRPEFLNTSFSRPMS